VIFVLAACTKRERRTDQFAANTESHQWKPGSDEANVDKRRTRRVGLDWKSSPPKHGRWAVLEGVGSRPLGTVRGRAPFLDAFWTKRLVRLKAIVESDKD
jgi:hypothetical protein